MKNIKANVFVFFSGQEPDVILVTEHTGRAGTFERATLGYAAGSLTFCTNSWMQDSKNKVNQ